MYNLGKQLITRCPMATNLSPTQLEIYRKSAREREAALRAQIESRRQRAWRVAREAAMILKDEFGASRVTLFGSVIYPARFHWRSDIDLAVWDIKDYFRAVSRLIDIDPEIEIDLVPIEDARPGIIAVIEREGIDL